MPGGIFLTKFEVFGNVVKHCLKFFLDIFSINPKLNPRGKLRNKIVKINANENQISKHRMIMISFVST